MENSSQQGRQQDLRFTPASTSTSSAGERPVMPNLMEQPFSSQDERVVSMNPSPDAATTRNSSNMTDERETLNPSGTLTTVRLHNSYSPQDQNIYYGGFDNGSASWGEYLSYINTNSLQVVPSAMHNDNLSLLVHSGYGFDAQMAYGQFSPMASALSPMMLDRQLYSPHQMPMSPFYYPQAVSPSMPPITSSLPISQSELVTPGSSGAEGLSDNMIVGPGSGYYLHFGSGGGNLSGNGTHGVYKFPGEFGFAQPLSSQLNSSDTGSYLSPLASSAVYPQPVGVLGSYEHNIPQISQQQTQFQGFGLASGPSAKHYSYGGPYRSSNYGSGSISPWEANLLNRLTPEKGRRRERNQDLVGISTDSYGISSDRNQGPRSSKPKGKNTSEENSSPDASKNGASASGIPLDLYNSPDFVTSYENAKFFIIKSFSEDNVHKSIKYGIWASTTLGNRKLDASYHQAKETKNDCPIFLFFSVNASGQFCGVAEMVGPVDFENDADYWQQDRWSGQFPVRWHIIKDVPNSRLRHILLENNDNKPVTHSRDSQEVKLEQGIEMLKILKEYDACTSILDDFAFYDEREKALHVKKARQQASSTKNYLSALADDSINQLSDNLAEALQLKENKEMPKTD